MLGFYWAKHPKASVLMGEARISSQKTLRLPLANAEVAQFNPVVEVETVAADARG